MTSDNKIRAQELADKYAQFVHDKASLFDVGEEILKITEEILTNEELALDYYDIMITPEHYIWWATRTPEEVEYLTDLLKSLIERVIIKTDSQG